MKKIEMRNVTVYYCDYCKKEIKGEMQELHSSIDKNVVWHLCRTITKDGDIDNCVVKFMKVKKKI